jgi:hypothetical protein
MDTIAKRPDKDKEKIACTLKRDTGKVGRRPVRNGETMYSSLKSEILEIVEKSGRDHQR